MRIKYRSVSLGSVFASFPTSGVHEHEHLDSCPLALASVHADIFQILSSTKPTTIERFITVPGMARGQILECIKHLLCYSLLFRTTEEGPIGVETSCQSGEVYFVLYTLKNLPPCPVSCGL